MGKSKHKISNWKQYNQALVQRGSLTVWMDEQAIQQWHCGISWSRMAIIPQKPRHASLI